MSNDQTNAVNPLHLVALRTHSRRANTLSQSAYYYFLSGGNVNESLLNFAYCIICDSVGDQASSVLAIINKGILKNIYLSLIEQTTSEDRQPITEAVHDLIEQALTVKNDISITVAVFINNLVYIGHVGDTRAYFIYKDQIEQITLDRSYVQQLIEKGNFDISSHNIIHRPSPKQADQWGIDIFIRRRAATSRFLMCSSEIARHVTNDEIQQIVLTNSPQEAADYLVSLVNLRVETENITVIIFN